MKVSSPCAVLVTPMGAVALLVICGSVAVQAQEEKLQLTAQVQAVPAGGTPVPPSSPPRTSSPRPGSPPNANSGDDGKRKAEEADAKKKEGDAAPPKVITRSDQPEVPGDPEQLNIEPNEEGKVRFNFEGQPWPAVLEWLARVSHLSLDWQELPGDYLNLRTQRDYTLEEARDLINRHLLARGFTMLLEGELLTVANIGKINVALVPRLEPEDLDQHRDYEFVKVSFPLQWILAESAVEELKPMLSPNGKLTALKGVNRIEAMDAVTNLRDIYRLLQQEQSEDATRNSIIRVYKLQHRRAGEVVLLLYDILGLDKNRLAAAAGGGGSMSDGMSRQILQQIQQMQQLLQQNRNNQQAGAAGGTPAEPRLIVNDRENSIIAHAPPDKMELIEQTIKAVDVPGDTASQLLQNVSRMKVYRLATLDPQPLMQILTELGDLSPQSRVQVDEKNRSLIVYGTLADHYTIQTLVERLDGSTRSFEVIQLRRVRADAVAGTIKYMFGVKDDENKDDNRNRYYYSYYSYGYGMNSQNQQEEQRPFRVDADVDNNRLLVWANEIELEEVRNLLVKLGEVPPGTSNPQTIRAFELNSDEEADRVLDRIRQLWPELNPNELKIQPAPQRGRTSPMPSVESDPSRTERTEGKSAAVQSVTPLRWALATFFEEDSQVVQASPGASVPVAEKNEPESAELSQGDAPVDLEREYWRRQGMQQRGEAPPILIQRGPNGRILFSSPDTAALDRLEELLGDIAPPPRDYRIFHLRPTTWAYGIEYNLKAYFKDEENQQSFLDWWGYSVTVNDQGPSRMSRRKPLKIISDEDSHTILVSGATPEQMQIIEDLIKIYDQPASSDPQALRRTEMFQLKYSRAVTVAETVKQVYRDLLSANDPALQNNNGKDQKPSDGPTFTYVYGRGGNSDESKNEPQQPIRFKGLLSVGVDEISNTVVVSAVDGLMPDISDLIRRLDEAARPTTTVQVLEVNHLNPDVLKERLERAYGIGASVKTSQTAQQNQNGQRNGNQPPQPGNQNGGFQGQPGAVVP